jgi:hypothetical protein
VDDPEAEDVAEVVGEHGDAAEEEKGGFAGSIPGLEGSSTDSDLIIIFFFSLSLRGESC